MHENLIVEIFVCALLGFSRRSSFDYGEGSKESEIVVLKERRLIPMKPVREGMQRFNLLLEVCVPGTVPDPQLIGAIMDLVSLPTLNLIKTRINNDKCKSNFNVAECSGRNASCTIDGMCTLRAKSQQQSMGIMDKAELDFISSIWPKHQLANPISDRCTTHAHSSTSRWQNVLSMG